MFAARLQSFVFVALAVSSLSAATPIIRRSSVTVNGNNNYNSGYLQNGNNVDFSISGSDNVSGVYNVGSGNSMNIAHSSISGNSKKVTKVTKVTGHHKREPHGSSSSSTTTTINGSNNGNSGDLQNGNNVGFQIGGSENISGVYNVGASNSLNVDHSSIAGNSKKVTKVTKVTGHHKREPHGSSSGSTTTTINGSNNGNSGDLQNGNNVGFQIGGSENISGVYNVGASNSLNIGHSSVSGNSKVTKITKVTGHHKREPHGSSSSTTTTTINGSNNGNSGSLQNGNNVDFQIGGSENISGVYNVGASSSLNVDHSSIAGNSKKVTKVTKVTGHHKREPHGSSSGSSSTTVNGSNNFNSGDLQNGNNVNFEIGGSDNISGVYNVGASNSMNIGHSSISGNSNVKKVTISKHH